MNTPTSPENNNGGLDAFGLGAVARYLAGPIIQGVGYVLKPLADRLANSAQVRNFNAWEEALKQKGYETKQIDLTIGARAEVRMLAEAIGHQANREAIAIEAIEHARTETVHPDDLLHPLPDADWIDRFWRLAENVSLPEMQSFWGLLLARTATGQAAVSARALDFLSTLSPVEAKKLERIAQFVIKVRVNDNFWDHAVLEQIADRGGAPSDYEAQRLLSELNGRLRHEVGDIDIPLFGSLGLFIESGLTHDVVQKVRGGHVRFEIAGQHFEAKVNSRNLDKYGLHVIGGYTQLSPLGAEIISIIRPTPNEHYFELLVEGFKIKGMDLLLVPTPLSE